MDFKQNATTKNIPLGHSAGKNAPLQLSNPFFLDETRLRVKKFTRRAQAPSLGKRQISLYMSALVQNETFRGGTKRRKWGRVSKKS